MIAKVLIVVGLTILAVGLLLHFAPGALKWFGRLPGDIYIERGNTKVFFPITSMILISLLLTLIVNLFFRR
ncbi:MAG TPA: DUF2905 domain-containing protein [Gammaproteobacteria bacterium]|nr:DUF2905 domain-containing protein [Gammaproteobacteria bacterium]